MRLGVVTDVHIAPDYAAPISWHSPLLLETAGARYTEALRLLSEQSVDAVVLLGDLTHLGDAPSCDELVRLSDATPAPMLWVLGNHDVVPSTTAIAEALERRGPDAPARLAGAAAHSVAGIPVYGVGIEPGEGTEVYVAREIPVPAETSIVLTHFPVVSRAEEFAERGVRYAGDLENRAEVERALAGHPTLVLCGHLHTRGVVLAGDTLQVSFGALVEEPFDVAVLDVDEALTSVHIEFIQGEGPWPIVDLPERVRFVRNADGWEREA